MAALSLKEVEAALELINSGKHSPASLHDLKINIGSLHHQIKGFSHHYSHDNINSKPSTMHSVFQDENQ